MEAGSDGRTRRDFLKNTGVLAGSALAAGLAPGAYAAPDNTIKLAIVGCGGRGTGALFDAMNCGGGPVKIVAMADIFEDRPQPPEEEPPRQGGRSARTPVPRLRRLQESN